ncbi:hypothetical protein BJ742DRAFT_737751 [Cladochytrium replicatum]|nr:hypothetical protein BJ742DRAFT_737751 [Cladochytrium replicatum]
MKASVILLSPFSSFRLHWPTLAKDPDAAQEGDGEDEDDEEMVMQKAISMKLEIVWVMMTTTKTGMMVHQMRKKGMCNQKYQNYWATWQIKGREMEWLRVVVYEAGSLL